jgi:hypothetical protein
MVTAFLSRRYCLPFQLVRVEHCRPLTFGSTYKKVFRNTNLNEFVSFKLNTKRFCSHPQLYLRRSILDY